MRISRSWRVLIVVGVFFLAACGPTAERNVDEGAIEAPQTGILTEPAGDTPFSFNPLLPFDGIPPIYDPEFVTASEIRYSDDELVIGVAIRGEAKAYAITILRAREMVNDELGGIPILVTW